MSTLSNLIFHDAQHKVTSPFGKRAVINTSAGATSSFHNGVDYGTYNKKLAQYAIADGTVTSCGVDTAYGGAKYVWVNYPSLGVKMLHYHLDSYNVKAGQKVTKDTVLGYTGKTGKATGIHLHLGMKRIGSSEWIDPEKWFMNEYKEKYTAGNYKVTKAELLNVRTGAGTKYKNKTFSQLTKSAQGKILALNKNKPADGYIKGLTFTVLEVKDNWGRTPSGWVCLDYCEVIK